MAIPWQIDGIQKCTKNVMFKPNKKLVECVDRCPDNYDTIEVPYYTGELPEKRSYKKN